MGTCKATYILLRQVEEVVLSVEHVVLLAGDHHYAVFVILRKPDVNTVVIHDALDVLSAKSNEAAVHARVDLNLLAVLAVLTYEIVVNK